MDDELTFSDVLETQAALLRGIFAELRAMRLEAQARAGRLSAVDAQELQQAQQDADQIALLFSPDEPDPVRVLS